MQVFNFFSSGQIKKKCLLRCLCMCVCFVFALYVFLVHFDLPIKGKLGYMCVCTRVCVCACISVSACFNEYVCILNKMTIAVTSHSLLLRQKNK